MSDGAKVAVRKPGRADEHCRRPESLPTNAHVPRYGYHVQHAMIRSDKTVMDAIFSLKPKELPNNGGWMLRSGSITAIAAATKKFTHDSLPMPRRTVAHRLAALRRKGIARPFEEHAKTSPVGTSWHLPLFVSILDGWAADPEVATIKKRAFFVRGKGRHLLTPAELKEWNLDVDAAERNPQTHANAVDLQQPEAAPAIELPAAPEVDLEKLRLALSDTCNGAESKDARWIWDKVVQVCGARPVPEVEEVAEMVLAIYRDFRRVSSKGRPVTIGWMHLKIGQRVEAWQTDRVRIQKARELAAQAERDQRIASYRSAIEALARSDLEPDHRRMYLEWIENAEPAELEQAKTLISRTA